MLDSRFLLMDCSPLCYHYNTFVVYKLETQVQYRTVCDWLQLTRKRGMAKGWYLPQKWLCKRSWHTMMESTVSDVGTAS